MIQHDLIQAINQFEAFCNLDEYWNINRLKKWNRDTCVIKKGAGLLAIIFMPSLIRYSIQLNVLMRKGEAIRNSHNDAFIKSEIQKYKEFLDSIEKFPLDVEQKEAIVCDEDSHLVVAAAGSGKTSTIVGKTSYLIKCKNVPAKDILLLAFTKKAAEEMKERLTKRFGIAINIRTFHSFGREILQISDGKVPDVIDVENQKYMIKTIFSKAISEGSALGKDVADYVLFHSLPYKQPIEFKSQVEYEEYYSKERLRCLKGHMCRSVEEREIADFLFLNSIDYLHEEPYYIDTATSENRQYKPDFYLPKHKIYIEHFGVNRKGEVPHWFDMTSEEYQSGIKWKRQLHKKSNTLLIETFSYEKQEGVIFKNLEFKLKSAGVEFKRINIKDLLRRLKINDYLDPICLTTLSFLNLYKSNYQNALLVDDMAKKDTTGRAAAFLRLFKYVYQEYEQRLRNLRQIDFSDMITTACKKVKEGLYKHSFGHIFVDEFQDISFGRMELLKTLMIARNAETRLFAVGDDWQSIYRFTGSDVSIMREFDTYFGKSRKGYLRTTYRYGEYIARLSEEFILENPSQIKKRVEVVNENKGLIDIRRDLGTSPMIEILDEIQEQTRGESSGLKLKVLILGRYGFRVPDDLRRIKDTHKDISVEFLTVHKAKGLEADYVVVNHVTKGRHGFPTEMADDPLLNLVLASREDYPHAEERRLFYVALTRAKKGVYVVTQSNLKSSFVLEVEDLIRKMNQSSLGAANFKTPKRSDARFAPKASLKVSTYEPVSYAAVKKIENPREANKGKPRIQCVYCKDTIGGERDLENHINKHIKDSYSAMTWEDIKKIKPNLPDKIHACAHCSFFQEPGGIGKDVYNHMTEEHPGELKTIISMPGDEVSFPSYLNNCAVCHKAIVHCELGRHLIKDHRDQFFILIS